MLRRSKGFTIIELLIVIVIIAILAAITIVAYNGITSRATDTSIREEAGQLHTKIMTWYQIKGSFPSEDDVASGLVDSEVPAAKLDTGIRNKIAASTSAITKDVPLSYEVGGACGGTTKIVYWQSAGSDDIVLYRAPLC